MNLPGFEEQIVAGGAVVIMIDALDELPRGGAVEAVLRLLADYFR